MPTPNTSDPRPYVGRFAPSPSGPLHAGSLVAALASYLDARAHRGRWLLRIEDIDEPRTVAGAERVILGQLEALGMHWDEAPVRQTARHPLYERAFARLRDAGRVYGCACMRRELPPGPYPGICRPPAGTGKRPIRSWRFLVEPGVEIFSDRWLGPQSQDVAAEVGDFIIRRADGLWAYQLVVVVDDGDQGITDVVRGADLLDSTARQRQLARALGLPLPRVLHVPLVLDSTGRKLSKQNHAPALDVSRPLDCLQAAWQALGFPEPAAATRQDFWSEATARWARRFGIMPPPG
ncbi:MAG: tRNA glutamyl-Q(34) synthetase GluQRS [Castellaniella sp.]|uniref:tRNA glutamyl-Q(34) synthetase GluQRS n=1 Tax=Castellaniella sp. TaxID=1955812 RepID=UPI002A35BFDE|nr:tRNA glutamyl-Q(34) synthetase GluQRS [Castellaniella sp.]MDY0308319.1 tRNA glutamyl-Q(34) synthetase GluQRS [Castellaniella sp.]